MKSKKNLIIVVVVICVVLAGFGVLWRTNNDKSDSDTSEKLIENYYNVTLEDAEELQSNITAEAKEIGESITSDSGNSSLYSYESDVLTAYLFDKYEDILDESYLQKLKANGTLTTIDALALYTESDYAVKNIDKENETQNDNQTTQSYLFIVDQIDPKTDEIVYTWSASCSIIINNDTGKITYFEPFELIQTIIIESE